MFIRTDGADPAVAVPLVLAAAGGLERLSPTARGFLDVGLAALPGAGGGTPAVVREENAPAIIRAESVPAVRPDDVAAARGMSIGARRGIIRDAITLVILSEDPSTADHERLRRAAEALDVTEPTVEVIAAVAAGQVPLSLVRTVEFDAYRSPLPRELRLMPAYRRYLDLGLPDGAVHGTQPDERLAALFGGLSQAPLGSAGRTLADFYAAEGWPMPGEPGGVALPLTLHDWLHVYLGVGIEPLGEVEVGVFAAGTTRHRYGFHNLLLALLMFEYGLVQAMRGSLGIGPAGAGARLRPDRDGARGVSGRADGGRMLADALLRGQAAGKDLYLGVDHLAEAGRDLDEIRRDYRIPPRGTFAAAA